MTQSEGSGPPDPKRTTRQYSRLVGIAFLAFAAFFVFKLVTSDKSAGTGLPPGTPAPRFAAPSAAGSLSGDANVFQTKQEAEAAGGKKTACQVEMKDAIRVCDFFDKPLVLVIWSTKCGGACIDQVDTVERVSGRYPNVNFLGLEVAGSKDEAAEVVRKRGWRMPIAVDQDGAVGALYNVAVPPAVFFILPGGRVEHSATGELAERYVVEDIDRLVKQSREQDRRAGSPT